jgi:hypothetical protein
MIRGARRCPAARLIGRRRAGIEADGGLPVALHDSDTETDGGQDWRELCLSPSIQIQAPGEMKKIKKQCF